MIDALRFVKGAMASKNLDPVLANYCIKDRRIYGFNGRLTLSAPLKLDFNIVLPGDKFYSAISACGEETSLTLMPKGGLSIKSGSFKARIQPACDPEAFPLVLPNGKPYEVTSDWMEALAAVQPFISDDASRPWSRGVLIKNGYVYATNNVILVRAKLPDMFDAEIYITAATIKELLRIKEQPLDIYLSENLISFRFEGDRWMTSNLGVSGWPDVESYLQSFPELYELPEGLADELSKLDAFTNELGHVELKDNQLIVEEAEVDLERPIGIGHYSLTMLKRVAEVATHADLNYYPKFCPFSGSNLEGVIIGVRK